MPPSILCMGWITSYQTLSKKVLEKKGHENSLVGAWKKSSTCILGWPADCEQSGQCVSGPR